eukprot:2912414-Rhodomonas_salina.1
MLLHCTIILQPYIMPLCYDPTVCSYVRVGDASVSSSARACAAALCSYAIPLRYALVRYAPTL